MKSVQFLGDSLKRLREFPEDARHDAGYQLDKLQRGLQPDDFKPMPTIGKGVEEIRRMGGVRDVSGDLHGASEGGGRRVARLPKEDAGNEQARHRAGETPMGSADEGAIDDSDKKAKSVRKASDTYASVWEASPTRRSRPPTCAHGRS